MLTIGLSTNTLVSVIPTVTSTSNSKLYIGVQQKVHTIYLVYKIYHYLKFQTYYIYNKKWTSKYSLIYLLFNISLTSSAK